MFAVSIRVPPAPTKASSCDAAASASVSRPQVIVPRPSLDTSRPLRPTRRESMTANLAGRRWLTRVRGGTRYRDLGVAPGSPGKGSNAQAVRMTVFFAATVTMSVSASAQEITRGDQQRGKQDPHWPEPGIRDEIG